MTTNSIPKIGNINLLVDVFGRFPSFHDAEVVRIVLNRAGVKTRPTLDAQIHVFEMTSELKDGRYVLKHHTLVTFQFIEVDSLSLDGFNNQNVLSGLSINDVSDHQLDNTNFEVSFDGIHGVDAQFTCLSIRIVDVTPFQPAH